jgi:hypothetical protein
VPVASPPAVVKPKQSAKPKAADKNFLPLAPEKRVRSDDPPPTIEQFRTSSFGRKAFRGDDDDDEDDGGAGCMVREDPATESADAASQVEPVFPSPGNLPPLPAAASAYDSVIQHNWFPELIGFLPYMVDTVFPMETAAARLQVRFFFSFFLVLCAEFAYCLVLFASFIVCNELRFFFLFFPFYFYFSSFVPFPLSVRLLSKFVSSG